MPRSALQIESVPNLRIIQEIERLTLLAIVPVSDLVTYKQAAQILGISYVAVRMLVYRGTLQRVSDLPRLDRREILEFKTRLHPHE